MKTKRRPANPAPLGPRCEPRGRKAIAVKSEQERPSPHPGRRWLPRSPVGGDRFRCLPILPPCYGAESTAAEPLQLSPGNLWRTQTHPLLRADDSSGLPATIAEAGATTFRCRRYNPPVEAVPNFVVAQSRRAGLQLDVRPDLSIAIESRQNHPTRQGSSAH